MLHLRNFRKISRPFSALVLVNFICVLISPTTSFALTGGPSSPQSSGFTAGGNGTSVNPFTGDFSYNIPLLDVGGYPLALNYNAGISPEDEASWVGLGWNLDVGSITRSVRGIADDYRGEEIVTEQHSKPNINLGLTLIPPNPAPFPPDPTKSPEIFGIPLKAGHQLGLNYNNYNGLSASLSVNPQLNYTKKSGKGNDSKEDKTALPINLPITFASDNVTISPSLSLSKTLGKNDEGNTLNGSVGFSFSSREGAKALSFGLNGIKASFDLPGFATPTYTTQSSFDMKTESFSFVGEFERGKGKEKEAFGVGGNFSIQSQKDDTEKNKSYGYMYEGISNSQNDLLDFNREKNAPVDKNTPNIGLANHTYDIFSVSGNGVGGAYRLFRDDVVSLGDDKSDLTTVGVSLGLSFQKSTDKLKIGVDLGGQAIGNERSNRNYYGDKHNIKNPINFTDNINQKIYFAKIGETTPENDPNYFGTYLGGTKMSTSSFNNKVGGYNRTKRRNLTTSFVYLTASDCKYGQFGPIISYDKSFSLVPSTNNKGVNLVSDVYKKSNPLERITDDKKGHHISEVRVTNESGQRYVYGIPVYNNKQYEVSFSIGDNGRSLNKTSGLATYNSAVDGDNSLKNGKGLDHYYQKRLVPAYANSYLLTYQLSHDYVDSDEIQGPSDGDLGNYVRFNYTKTSDSYKWRTPFEENKANYSDGLAGKKKDDKASYTYGEKELWYPHSIETRDYIVEFELEAREDGIGVKGENGGLESNNLNNISNGNKQMRIKEIRLYSKRDRLKLGNAEPLKTVHFEYDYSLCPGTPNSLASGKGKLTLKKVWFTYGNSNKGEKNKYEFVYGDVNYDGITDAELNPSYNKTSLDRWGTYKKAEENIGNEEFPYTIQDKTETDKYVAAYCMNRIFTPTGGEIRVHYESDDYAYVQDKSAMRMFKIKGVESIGRQELYSNSIDFESLNKKVFVDLGDGIDGSLTPDQANQFFKDQYLREMKYLQFKISSSGFGSGDETWNDYENISGYCNFKGWYVEKDNATNYNVGVIILEDESLNRASNPEIHPFVKNAWLFAKIHYNNELSGLGELSDRTTGNEILLLIPKMIDKTLKLILSFKAEMKAKKIGAKIDLNKSYLRLYEGDQIKLGGGHRVKAIVMFDRWDNMKAKREPNSSSSKTVSAYGQKYEYTTINPSNNKVISSGVAAYEPIIGGEENPWREIPDGLKQQRVWLAPDKEFYNELPYGESYMPSPQVGYSKVVTTPVKIKDRNYNVNALESNGTGTIEEEFYTANDFPTFISFTSPYIHTLSNLEKAAYKAVANLNPYYTMTPEFFFCSQSYLVELNDMHGKPKSKKVLSDKASKDTHPISYVEYKYKTDVNNPKKLDSNVPLVNSNLDVLNQPGRELGTTIDVCHDVKHLYSFAMSPEFKLNITLVPPSLPTFPILVPTGSLHGQTTSFDSKVTTKVVNRYGVLVETIVYENGQNLTTSNLAWDETTGDVLLTRVDNEFHNQIYAFNYPAHWAYKTMGLASNNEGFKFSKGLFSSAKNHLVDGDEIMLENGLILNSNIVANQRLYCYYDAVSDKLIDKEGKEITSYTNATVIRSGKRNVASMSIGSVSMLKNPLLDNKIVIDPKYVLNTGAVELKNVWKGFCNCGETELSSNPFVLGQRGQLRVWRNWTYLTSRTQNRTNGELNIRQDGMLTDYSSFWMFNATQGHLEPFYYGLNETEYGDNDKLKKWQFVTEVKNFNPVGQEIENKDALERYSMAQFGYGRNLPVGVSNNSKYNESGFDGFEDYGYDDCSDDHFSWRKQVTEDKLSTQAHTGLKSLEVKAGSKVSISKDLKNCDN